MVFSTEIPCSQHYIEQECRELLELVLDRKVGELACINRQKPVEITANGKGVRFDVYAEGSDSIIYDIEMQRDAKRGVGFYRQKEPLFSGNDRFESYESRCALQTNWKMKYRKPVITSNGGQSI